MKFKITLTPSNYYQDAKKSKNLNPVVVRSLEYFKKVIFKYYPCAVYKDNHRSIDDFLYADAIVFDIDNDHSENPDDWITLIKYHHSSMTFLSISNTAGTI